MNKQRFRSRRKSKRRLRRKSKRRSRQNSKRRVSGRKLRSRVVGTPGEGAPVSSSGWKDPLSGFRMASGDARHASALLALAKGDVDGAIEEYKKAARIYSKASSTAAGTEKERLDELAISYERRVKVLEESK